MAYQKLILVTDASKVARSATESAFELARQHNAEVLIVDTLRRPSRFSTWLSGNGADYFDLVTNDKQERLDKVAQTFLDAGIDVQTRLLIGNSSEIIARVAVEEQADLVVRYMKGLNSRVSGPFGATAQNLIYVCPCPLLLVTDDRPIKQPKVLACINAEHNDPENDAILSAADELAGASHFDLLYCWDFYGNEYMAQYIGDDLMRQYMEESERNYRHVFNEFLQRHQLSLDDEHVHLEKGSTCELIPLYCKRQNVDVVVMSTNSQHHPLHRLFGSTVESVLDTLPCSLLAVKPLGFRSPFAPDLHATTSSSRQQ